ncbi:MAG: FIST C-terminal domain-containing protein [Anaerolineaceae bacterium]|nr:FIST C-terminal domain-containing protein [Anaerolineaceae bacterium]
MHIKKMAETTPAEIYSRVFDQPVGEWGSPPLSELIRLYPLGVELSPGSNDFNLRSPLAVEPDGSFLMNAPVPEGQIAHILVGDPDACLEAVRILTRHAIRDLGSAEPLLALAFVDSAWHLLLKNRLGKLCEALQDELGDIPFIGGYTSGQIFRSSPEVAPQHFTHHCLMVLLGRS